MCYKKYQFLHYYEYHLLSFDQTALFISACLKYKCMHGMVLLSLEEFNKKGNIVANIGRNCKIKLTMSSFAKNVLSVNVERRETLCSSSSY